MRIIQVCADSRSINRDQVLKKFEDLQKCDPEKLSKSFILLNSSEKEIEAAKDDYSGENIAHYCVANSHFTILCKIISLDSTIVQRCND